MYCVYKYIVCRYILCVLYIYVYIFQIFISVYPILLGTVYLYPCVWAHIILCKQIDLVKVFHSFIYLIFMVYPMTSTQKPDFFLDVNDNTIYGAFDWLQHVLYHFIFCSYCNWRLLEYDICPVGIEIFTKCRRIILVQATEARRKNMGENGYLDA